MNEIEQELRTLRDNWDGAYTFWHDGRKFRAKRADDDTELSADSGPKLNVLVAEDYTARPVARPDR